MNDDILAEINSLDDPVAKQQEERKQEFKNSGNRGKTLWERKDIKPREIKVEDLQKSGDVYTIAIPDSRVDIPKEIVEKFVKIVTSLNDKGYTLRLNLPETVTLTKQLEAIPNVKIDHYLPWPKYNSTANNIIIKRPTEKAYATAAYLVKNYFDRPDAVRCIEANIVQTMLGTECITPVKFVLIWSSDGAEAITKDINFDVVKNLTSYFRITKACGIPVYNIQKEDALSRLTLLLK